MTTFQYQKPTEIPAIEQLITLDILIPSNQQLSAIIKMIGEIRSRHRTIKHRSISARDISEHSHTVSLTIKDCTSHRWRRVTTALAGLAHLTILTILRCDIGDHACNRLMRSASIRSLQLSISPKIFRTMRHFQKRSTGSLHAYAL